MCRPLPAVFASSVLILSSTAQAVLTVGVGGQFTDLPAAIGAAQPGDRVQCLGMFQTFTAPTITRGITVLGGGVNALVGPMSIIGVPTGEAVVVQGFLTVGTPLEISVIDCAGRVHLDDCSTGNTAQLSTPSLQILRSVAVSMHHVTTYGAPAVSVVDSTLTIDQCRFLSGRSIDALRSTVWISDPHCTPGAIPLSTIFADQSTLTITGRSDSRIYRSSFGATPPPAIEGTNSTLTLSPLVPLFPSAGAITGFSPILRDTPFQQVQTRGPGLVTTLTTVGPAGGIGLAGLSAPSGLVASPLGTLWVDPSALVAYGFVIQPTGLPTGDRHSLDITVPATVPPGSTWTLQGVVLTSTGIDLTLPSTFTIKN